MVPYSRFAALSLFVLTLFCLQCGRRANYIDAPITQDGATPKLRKVQLIVFGAPWCHGCHQDLPIIDANIHAELSGISEQISHTLYVVTGEQKTSRPSQGIADQYNHDLNSDYTARPDPWFFTTYKKYFPKERTFAIPAGILLDENSNVLEIFPAGNFDPIEIIQKIKQWVST